MKKRLLIVDEAWYMMKYPDSASFLQGIAKRCRKYYLGLTTLTQDIEDFLSSDYGKAILSSSSVQILLKQGSSEVELLAKTLNLSEGEKQYLLTAQVGEGLLFAGQNHVTAQFVASQFEYDLVTSKPQDTIQPEPSPTPPPAPEAPPAPEEPSLPIQPSSTEIPTFQPNLSPAPTQIPPVPQTPPTIMPMPQTTPPIQQAPQQVAPQPAQNPLTSRPS